MRGDLHPDRRAVDPPHAQQVIVDGAVGLEPLEKRRSRRRIGKPIRRERIHLSIRRIRRVAEDGLEVRIGGKRRAAAAPAGSRIRQKRPREWPRTGARRRWTGRCRAVGRLASGAHGATIIGRGSCRRHRNSEAPNGGAILDRPPPEPRLSASRRLIMSLRMRLIGRNDLFLLLGLTVALFAIFSRPLAQRARIRARDRPELGTAARARSRHPGRRLHASSGAEATPVARPGARIGGGGRTRDRARGAAGRRSARLSAKRSIRPRSAPLPPSTCQTWLKDGGRGRWR